MILKYCIDCGCEFWAETHEHWKIRCISCWKQQKSHLSDYEAMVRELVKKIRDLQIENNNLRTELGFLTAHSQEQKVGIVSKLRAHYKDLVFLCHPDRHPGCHKAHEITSWLNSEVRNA